MFKLIGKEMNPFLGAQIILIWTYDSESEFLTDRTKQKCLL